MLEAVPRSLFSWDFDILEDNKRVAVLDLAWFHEGGELIIGNQAYQIGREGLMSGAFSLKSDGQTTVSATNPSAFVRSFDLVIGPQRYKLEASSPFSRKFVLIDAGKQIGSIAPQKKPSA